MVKYLRGDVYGYQIEAPSGDHVASCYGFYGLEECETEARAEASALPRVTPNRVTIHIGKDRALSAVLNRKGSDNA